MKRPRWEILIGDTAKLDYLHSEVDDQPHPLQEILEAIVENELTDDEKDVFYMRYGERMSIRDIAKAQDYDSHYVIQVKLQNIKRKVREALEQD